MHGLVCRLPWCRTTDPSSFLLKWHNSYASWGFTTSNPGRYPQFNWMVERFHRLLRERRRGLRPSIPFSHRLQQALMDIRNSRHRMLGTTPSEALFNHVLRTRVPIHIKPVIVNPMHQVRAKAQMAQDHDSKRGVHVHPPSILKPGTAVALQDGYMDPGKRWQMVEQYGQQVGVSDGQRILLRNRRHVREYDGRPQEDQWTSDPLSAQSPSNTSEVTGCHPGARWMSPTQLVLMQWQPPQGRTQKQMKSAHQHHQRWLSMLLHYLSHQGNPCSKRER